MILVDDLGWTDLGCYGSTFYDTPRLDAFAAGAARFTNAYAASPVCSPTRAAIMTGKNPARLHITDWIPGMLPSNSPAALNKPLLGPAIPNSLPKEERTLAEVLRAEGYQTFFAGKWHLGDEGSWPQDHGFDINRGGHHRGSPPGGYYAPYKNPQLSNGPKNEYLTDRLTTEATDFLQNRDTSRPFFLCLWYYTVHSPIQGCAAYDQHYKSKAASLPHAGAAQFREEHQGRTRTNQSDPKYAAMVRSMDTNVGKVLDALDKLQLTDHTAVVFTSDNGGLSTLAAKRRAPTAVLPLRGGKGWCYEGGIRVPLMLRLPGVTQPGQTCSAPSVSMDLYPTILAAAGLDLQPTQHQDGIPLQSQLPDAEATHDREIVWHFPHYHGSAWAPGSAIRQGPWKLVEFYEDETVELYNLEQDLGESNNLASSDRQRADQLRARMHAHLKAYQADYPSKP
jgi:arylsulfatase A-like enzyme